MSCVERVAPSEPSLIVCVENPRQIEKVAAKARDEDRPPAPNPDPTILDSQ